MVAATGEESPVDLAFNDIFEVIQDIENMQNSVQIVPGRDYSTEVIKNTHGGLAEARIYGTDLNLSSIKIEQPKPVKEPCVHTSQFSQWVNLSINADKLRCSTDSNGHIIPTDFSTDSLEDAKWEEKLISETKNLFQSHTSDPRDYSLENYRNLPTLCSPANITDCHLVPEFDCSSWIDQPFTDELSINKFEKDELNLQEDPYLSEYSSDNDSVKPIVKQEEEATESRPCSLEAPNPWTGTLDSQRLQKKPQVAKLQIRSRCKTSFKSGRPRLCQFLLELLENPDKYSNLIEWLDKEKGVFKFLNSSRVAQEWGTRRNKPRMKYENFARSLRTYIAKGILTKPRSKLVYRFSSY